MSDLFQDRIEAIVAATLGNGEPLDSGTAGLYRTMGWDSFAQITIVLELERTFGIEFSPEEIERCVTLQALIELSFQKSGRGA